MTPELSPEDLKGFTAAQRLAYECTTAVGSQLKEGMTEIEATQLMSRWLAKRGVDSFFHTPFAWFGDRTAFAGDWNLVKFAATLRRLKLGMPVILDVAPVVNGYTADVGHAMSFGPNPVHAKMVQDLALYRNLILDGVTAGTTMRAIYREVGTATRDLGYEAAHEKYPYGTLGHLVSTSNAQKAGGRLSAAGFGLRPFGWTAGQFVLGKLGLGKHFPIWNGTRICDRPAPAGMWAMEPHIAYNPGSGTIGVKWEELLVVSDGGARWLDDRSPHVAAWSTQQAA